LGAVLPVDGPERSEYPIGEHRQLVGVEMPKPVLAVSVILAFLVVWPRFALDAGRRVGHDRHHAHEAECPVGETDGCLGEITLELVAELRNAGIEDGDGRRCGECGEGVDQVVGLAGGCGVVSIRDPFAERVTVDAGLEPSSPGRPGLDVRVVAGRNFIQEVRPPVGTTPRAPTRQVARQDRRIGRFRDREMQVLMARTQPSEAPAEAEYLGAVDCREPLGELSGDALHLVPRETPEEEVNRPEEV